jgi:plasmid replication initiation protein
MVDEFGSPVPTQGAATFKKAVPAIAIVPKTGKITLLTRKLFNVLLASAQSQAQALNGDLLVYRTALSKITTNSSFNSNDTALIKEHLRKMNSIQVEWNESSKDTARRWGVTNLLAEVEIIEDKDSHSTFLEWSYAPKIKKRLLEPEVYARISLQMLSSLRSSTSVSLYEICARYATSPNNLTMREKWEWWRPVLTGSPDAEMERETYKEYKYFKRDVLKCAVAELNQVTELNVELLEYKDGRSVKELQFRVTKKAQAHLPLVDRSVLNMGLVDDMVKLGMSYEEAAQIYSNTEEHLIVATLKAVKTRASNKAGAPLENPAAWFRTVLRRGLTEKPAALPAQPKTKPKPKQTPDELRGRYISHKLDEARGLYRELSEFEQAALGDKFREHLRASNNSAVEELFNLNGLSSKLVEMTFFAWLVEHT